MIRGNLEGGQRFFTAPYPGTILLHGHVRVNKVSKQHLLISYCREVVTHQCHKLVWHCVCHILCMNLEQGNQEDQVKLLIILHIKILIVIRVCWVLVRSKWSSARNDESPVSCHYKTIQTVLLIQKVRVQFLWDTICITLPEMYNTLRLSPLLFSLSRFWLRFSF